MAQPLKVVHISSIDLGILFLMPQLRALQADGFEVHAMCADGALVPSFEAEGIRMHRIAVTREVTPLADLRLLWQLVQIIRREKYTIVHTHTEDRTHRPVGRTACPRADCSLHQPRSDFSREVR